MSVTTSEETIPPIPLNGVGSELERWAAEARVESRPVEGVWWRRAGTEDLSLQDQAKKGLIALQFHGGGYMLGSAKEVQSGFSRMCAFVPRFSHGTLIAMHDTIQVFLGAWCRYGLPLYAQS